MQIMIHSSADMEPLTTFDLPPHLMRRLREGDKVRLMLYEHFNYAFDQPFPETTKCHDISIFAKHDSDGRMLIMTDADPYLVKLIHSCDRAQEQFEYDLRKAMNEDNTPSPRGRTPLSYS